MNTKNLLQKKLIKGIFLLVLFTVLVSYEVLMTNITAEAMEINAFSNTISYAELRLNKATDNLTVGDQDSLNIMTYPSYVSNKNVTWTSSNSNVVKVSDGNITAVGAGIATITANVGGETASCVVTVINKISVTLVSLSKTEDTLDVGYSDSVYATLYPSNATCEKIIWTSSNPDIVKVSDGYITAVSEGKATITAAAEGETASCIVTVNGSNSAASITLSKTSINLNAGYSDSLYATVYPYQSVVWTSSDPDVAKVSGGYVTAVSKGTATITAAAGSKTASCVVKVNSSNPVISISISTIKDTLKVGDNHSIYATVYPSNADDSSIVWTSSDPGVAKVSDGHVTAVAEGTATITATAGGKTVSCVVNVNSPVSLTYITLNSTIETLIAGNSRNLNVIAYPSNAEKVNVTWTSSNPDVAKVSDGYVTAVSEGKATITATAEGKTASCTVTVDSPILVTSIALNKTTETLRVGDISALREVIYPRNATNKCVTWTSSNPDVAKVTPYGRVTAISEGTATITATVGGKTATYTVTVGK